MEILPLWEARVETEEGRPAAPGEAGLLVLRGAALAAGRGVRTADGWQFSGLADAEGWWRPVQSGQKAPLGLRKL